MMICGGVLYPWLFLLALSRTSATNTSLLIALNPVLTVLLAPLVGEPLDRRRMIGVARDVNAAMSPHTSRGAPSGAAFDEGGKIVRHPPPQQRQRRDL